MWAHFVVISWELTVVILVHQCEYSVTDVFNIPCDARIIVHLYLVDDLKRWKKENIYLHFCHLSNLFNLFVTQVCNRLFKFVSKFLFWFLSLILWY